MERQYLIFIIAVAVGFSALLIVGFFFNPLKAAPQDSSTDSGNIQAKIGKTVYVHYSSGTIGLVQKLPEKNQLRIEAPSELLNTNLAGLKGEVRYTDMTITYVQGGKQETINEKDFKSVVYKFLPDAGNVTSYTYDNVKVNTLAQSSEIIVSFVPLSTAQVGQQYPVKMILKGEPVDIAIDPKIVEIVG